MSNTTKKYTVEEVSDNDGENFTLSTCSCDSCLAMHQSSVEWNKYKPTNALQRNMINVVEKIEKRIKNK